jgi:hypothetical protein
LDLQRICSQGIDIRVEQHFQPGLKLTRLGALRLGMCRLTEAGRSIQ